jgi:hypothetical protein
MVPPTQIDPSIVWPPGAPCPHGAPARPACRLHLRVRQAARQDIVLNVAAAPELFLWGYVAWPDELGVRSIRGSAGAR